MLLCCQFFLVFFFVLFQDLPFLGLLVNLVLTLLFTSGILTISYSEGVRSQRWDIPLYISIPILWLNFFVKNPILDSVATTFITILFFAITINMILKLMKSRSVDYNVLLEAVNGFFLLGIMGAMVFAYISRQAPDSYSGTGITKFHDAIYFSFITITSIGYGDISPVSQIARSASLFFGIAGQLYTTFLIAFLVGKFSNNR